VQVRTRQRVGRGVSEEVRVREGVDMIDNYAIDKAKKLDDADRLLFQAHLLFKVQSEKEICDKISELRDYVQQRIDAYLNPKFREFAGECKHRTLNKYYNQMMCQKLGGSTWCLAYNCPLFDYSMNMPKGIV